MRRILMVLAMLPLIVAGSAIAEEPPKATVYKDPQCGCCEGYVAYLKQNGFDVAAVNTHDLPLIKQQHGVPSTLEGCHTTIIGDYVVEGHVPVATLRKLLSEKPRIKGISLPGMPAGSPGMSGTKATPFKIYEITEGAPQLYATD